MDDLFEYRLNKLSADVNTLLQAVADIRMTLRSIERQVSAMETRPTSEPINGAQGIGQKTIGGLGYKNIGES